MTPTELRILILEDDLYDAELAVGLLEEAGIACRWERVDSRDAFLARLEAREHDLVLSDYSLPSFDGRSALRLFTELELDIPFIFLSGAIGEDVAIDSIKAGATDYVLKTQMSRLVPVVRRALQEQEVRRQRRLAEEKLHQREDRFRKLMEQSWDLILLIDAQAKVLYASESLAAILGYSPEEWLGRPGLSFVHPEDLGATQKTLASLLDGPGVMLWFEVRVGHKDGSFRWLEIAARNLLGDPNVKAIMGNCRDVTERKRLEEQLLQSQKMEAIGRLAGGMAHDFNNLLTAVLGCAHLLSMKTPAIDQRRDYIEQIIQASERGASLIRQLLAFARKQIVEPKVIDLNQLVLSMTEMLHRLIGEDVELVNRTAPDLWRVKVDPTQFQQVLVNLVVNARDAMPTGGVVTIETCNWLGGGKREPEDQAGIFGPHVLLSVSDTGTGMDPATMQRLFEPFFTTKELGRGTGLGLATCYGTVRQAGGHIRVESAPDRGTIFRIYLPCVPDGERGTEPEAVRRQSPTGSETILLVEDDPMVRDLIAEMLSSRGYDVLRTASGTEAQQLFRKHDGQIHLLLTDVVLPRMSGPELAQALCSERPGLKVLYVSGHTGDLQLRPGALRSGNAFLPKPFGVDTLADKVREVLDQP